MFEKLNDAPTFFVKKLNFKEKEANIFHLYFTQDSGKISFFTYISDQHNTFIQSKHPDNMDFNKDKKSLKGLR